MLKKTFKGLTILAVNLISFATIGAIGGLAYYYSKLPNVNDLTRENYVQPLEVYDIDSNLLTSYGDERVSPVSFNEIPPYLIDILLATIDPKYKDSMDDTDRGVNFSGIFRSRPEFDVDGNMVAEGPTLPHYFANHYFKINPETSSKEKILSSVLLSTKVDHNLSYQEMITLLVNILPLGNKAYGFAAGAKTYFAKELNNLTVPEIALLVAVSENPSYYNPFTHLDRVIERRNTILKTLTHYKGYNNSQLTAFMAEKPVIRSGYQDFVKTYATEIAREAMVKSFGEAAYRDGYKVYLSIHKADQDLAQISLRTDLLDKERLGLYHGVKDRAWNLSEVKPDNDKIQRVLNTYNNYAPIFPVVVLDIKNDSLEVMSKDGGKRTISKEVVKWGLTQEQKTSLKKDPATPNDLPALLPGGNKIAKKLAKELETEVAKGSDSALPQVHLSLRQAFPKGSIIYLEIKPTSKYYKQSIELMDRYADFKPLSIPDSELTLAQIPSASSGALVSLDSQTGAIQSFVGGFAFGLDKTNAALEKSEAAGSILKPFLYSFALSRGETFATIEEDKPVDVSSSSDENKVAWVAENFDGKYSGNINYRAALGKNVNTVPLKIAGRLGLKEYERYLAHFALEVPNYEFSYRLALGDFTVNPLSMARAYAVFDNGGYLINPYIIDTVVDRHNNLVYKENNPKVCSNCKDTPDISVKIASRETESANFKVGESTIIHKALSTSIYDLDRAIIDPSQTPAPVYAPKVINSEIAYLIRDALNSNITGRKDFTGNAEILKPLLSSYKRDDLGGMKGTDYDQQASWFAGYAGNKTGIAVVYNEKITTSTSLEDLSSANVLAKNNSKENSDKKFPNRGANVWLNYMDFTLASIPRYNLARPKSILTLNVNPTNGYLDSKSTAVVELFAEGTEPTKKAYVEVKAPPKVTYITKTITVQKKVTNPVATKKPKPKKKNVYKEDGTFNDDEFGFYD